MAKMSYFGFATSKGRKYQLNRMLAWNMTVEKIAWDDEPNKSKSVLTLVLAFGVHVAMFALAAASKLATTYG